jgi:hypothetical protein
MATLGELSTIRDNPLWGTLLGKVRAACVIKAAAVIDSESPGAAVLEWAKQVLKSPSAAGDGIIYYVIGKVGVGEGVTLSTIYGAPDTAIQNNVDAAVDAIYGA